ncbi:POTRA domain-containing protein [Dialister invisus]|uniref:POTRA domain-containing protein n=1 Tax=Dialister invisus TaxID=218538 RepID=UPI00352001A0
MKNGKLLLRIQTGRLHKIIYSKNSAVIPWKNAFPIKEGDILNIRRLEQGLEQMKRVSSSDVSMKLLPAEEADMTDVELSITKGKQIRGKPFRGRLRTGRHRKHPVERRPGNRPALQCQ